MLSRVLPQGSKKNLNSKVSCSRKKSARPEQPDGTFFVSPVPKSRHQGSITNLNCIIPAS